MPGWTSGEHVGVLPGRTRTANTDPEGAAHQTGIAEHGVR